MGTDDVRFPADGEGPVRDVDIGSFEIAPTLVTNAEFGAFVDASGHVTIAEREGWSFVFGGLLPDEFPPTRGVVGWRTFWPHGGLSLANGSSPFQQSLGELQKSQTEMTNWRRFDTP